MSKRLITALALSFGLLTAVACQARPEPTSTARPAATAVPTPTPAAPAPATPAASGPWWNDRVFYEVFVRSFQDSNGDGIGDLQGLISRLDYLNDGDPATDGDLGVTGLWLMPVFASPSYHGYDVTDYRQINPEYGTLDDFKKLLDEAHKRGIAVVVDFPLNHTSNQHPWFEASASGDGAYASWYLWASEPPFKTGPWGQQVWHPYGDRYYYGLFWEGMPDLNLENPEVTAELHDIARYWIEEVGVDGFRLDGVKHLIEEGATQENTAATHAWLQDFHKFYKSVDPDTFTVGEAWTTSDLAADYAGDEADIVFEFDLAEGMVLAARQGASGPVSIAQALANKAFPPRQFASFLTNHDQNRVMSQLGSDAEAAKVAATLLLTGPGVPFLYYGEEVGMEGVKPDEDIRLPMQWDGSAAGGFTTGSPWRGFGPGQAQNNVALQTLDPTSLLSHYRRLIRVRNEQPALRTGEHLKVSSSDGAVYAFLRHSGGESLLVLVNLSPDPVSNYSLSMPEGPLTGNPQAALLLGQGQTSPPTLNAAGGFDAYTPMAELPPRSSFIIRLAP